ncbi:MAG: hypothetical protein WD995_07795 [Gemmatimonadota bacterium]
MSLLAGDLGARVEAVRRHLRRRSAFAAGTWAATGLAIIWVVAWIFAGQDGWRSGSAVPAILDLAIVLWFALGVYLFRWLIDDWLDEARLSRAMEGAASLREGEVRGSLELVRQLPVGVSSSLVKRAAARAVAGLQPYRDPELSGDLGRAVALWTRRGWGALLGATLVFVILTALAPERTARAWAGLSAPLAVLSGPDLPALGVNPGDVEVMRGTDVEIVIDAEGRRTVDLQWQAVGEVARTERLEVSGGRAVHVLRDVQASTDYSVRGDAGLTSASFRITPVDPLFVSDLTIGLDFPPHTDLGSEEYRGAAPNLRIPAGTRFTFEGRANRPLESVALTDSAGLQAAGLSVDGGAFQGGWTPSASGRYSWRFRDARGEEPDITPEPLGIVLLPDEAPFLEILAPGVDTVLATNLRQELHIEAADDYGLDVLELVAYRVTAVGERREPVVQRIDLGGTRATSLRPILDFDSWGLLAGDEVRYLARVSDNAPGGQWAETREYVLRMPSANELRRGVERALEDAAERLAEMAEEAGAQADENRQQARERELGRRAPQPEAGGSASPGERGFEEREELQRAVDEQEVMSTALDSLRSELETLERRMAEAGQADPELRAQLRELQSLLSEVNGEELQESVRQLSESLEREDTGQAERSLEQLAAEQESLRERLEESLERFRRAAVEQDFRSTRSEAEELARQERALADAMREDGESELRARQQEELANRADDLEARVERLEERLRELGEEAAAEGVREASTSAEQARSEMREAARRATEGDAEEAASQAEGASKQLDQAAQELAQAQQEMARQQLEQIRRALERTSDDALSLARRQAELRSGMRQATQDELTRMRVDEASLLQGVENMADNLRLATEGQAPGGREISAQMGRAMESLERTIAAMDRPRSLGGSPFAEAERVVGDLNRLALMAMEGAEQMGQDGPGEGQEGQQQMQQALEDLAQQQGDLVNQAGQIMPMQLGEQALSEQLQRMSGGQQSISDQLGDLSDQPASENALGDLDQLAVEAAELAEMLAEGRLDPETARRQERLFHRLLDAGRSLEREEFSDERESEAPATFERGTVLPLDEGEMGVLPFEMPDAEQLRALSPGVRRLILDYFERLNRDPASGGGAR